MPIVSLLEGLNQLRMGAVKGPIAAITFDDGYLDNYELALPILQSIGIPATFFVATGFLGSLGLTGERLRDGLAMSKAKTLDLKDMGLGDGGFETPSKLAIRFDQIKQALKYKSAAERDQLTDEIVRRLGADGEASRMMDEHHLSKLVAHGMNVGSHSHRHIIPTTASLEEFKIDLAQSFSTLDRLLGPTPRLYAYPNGKYGKDYHRGHFEILRDLNIEYALATDNGLVRQGFNQFAIPRFTPWDNSPHAYKRRLLLAQLYLKKGVLI